MKLSGNNREKFEFLGNGPSATGPSGGWEFDKGIYVHCGKCNNLLHPWGIKKNSGCTCGNLFLDVDYRRFTAKDGDDSVEVYRKK